MLGAGFLSVRLGVLVLIEIWFFYFLALLFVLERSWLREGYAYSVPRLLKKDYAISWIVILASADPPSGCSVFIIVISMLFLSL